MAKAQSVVSLHLYPDASTIDSKVMALLDRCDDDISRFTLCREMLTLGVMATPLGVNYTSLFGDDNLAPANRICKPAGCKFIFKVALRELPVDEEHPLATFLKGYKSTQSRIEKRVMVREHLLTGAAILMQHIPGYPKLTINSHPSVDSSAHKPLAMTSQNQTQSDFLSSGAEHLMEEFGELFDES